MNVNICSVKASQKLECNQKESNKEPTLLAELCKRRVFLDNVENKGKTNKLNLKADVTPVSKNSISNCTLNFNGYFEQNHSLQNDFRLLCKKLLNPAFEVQNSKNRG